MAAAHDAQLYRRVLARRGGGLADRFLRLGQQDAADGEGTLKKYIQRGNSVVLQPFNPAYDEMVIKGEELDHLYIAGKVVETKAKW